MKLTKTQKTIIRQTWKAWATFSRYSWEAIVEAGIEPKTRSALYLAELIADNKRCSCLLAKWAALDQLAEELNIDWLSGDGIDDETAQAAADHRFYQHLIYTHQM